MNIEVLKNMREDKQLTQNDIAKMLNISRSTYTSFETERDIIPIKHLNKLCNYFNISIDYVLGISKTIRYKNSKPDIDINIVKDRIKEFRKSKRLTQKEIAYELNIPRSTWTNYEYGKFQMKTIFLYELAKKYNYSIDYLLGKIDKNPIKKINLNTK